MKDRKNFLKKIDELKFYIIEFDKFNIIKPKIYPLNCAINGDNQQLVILIIHNKYIFLTHDKIY